MKKYIIFDFNGTLLNDVDLGLELINEFLIDYKRTIINMDTYKSIFGFPVYNYYKKAGLDINLEEFEKLAVVYNEKYKSRSKNCRLFDSVIPCLESLFREGYSLIVLSATEKNNLIEQLKYYNILKYFDHVLGTDNHKAISKVDIGLKFIKDNNINKEEVIIIGDTDHDYLVSTNIGTSCLLFSKGHQSVEVLEKCNSIIINDLDEIKRYL